MSLHLLVGIVTYNSRQHIDRCLESVFEALAEMRGDCLIVVVDNDSTDGTAAHLEAVWSVRGVRVIRAGKNAGFAAGVNLIAAAAESEFLCILNPDLVLDPSALVTALEHLSDCPDVGLVGGNLLNPSGESEWVFGALPTPFKVWFSFSSLRRLPHPQSWDLCSGLDAGVVAPQEVDYPCGALWIIRRSAWAAVGPFDERYFLYFEETDWANRCGRAGWKVMLHPGVRALHEGGGSSGRDRAARVRTHTFYFRSAFQYLAKHHGIQSARSTFRSMKAMMGIKQALLGFRHGLGSNVAVVYEALVANEAFVFSSELSGSQALVSTQTRSTPSASS